MYHKRKSMQVPSLYVKPNNVLQFKQTGLQKQAMHILEGKSIIAGNEQLNSFHPRSPTRVGVKAETLP